MKFRSKSNFIPLELDQIVLDLIGDYYSPVDLRNLSKLLAAIMLKEPVEDTLDKLGYVIYEE